MHMQKSAQSRYYTILILLAILLIGATLRSPISSIGPLVPFFREDLGISNATVGFLNTLPLLAFGLFSPFIPKISSKLGMEVSLMIAMAVLFAGIMLRATDGVAMLILGTALIGLSIAVGNVLSPGLINATFPFHLGIMTGLYSVSMNLVSALSSGVSVSVALSPQFDWRFAMQMWGIFPAIAVLVFLLRLPVIQSEKKKVFAEVDSSPTEKMWKSKLAWSVTFFMGLQSLIPYSLFAWLPVILTTKGFTEAEAGWLMTIYQIGLLPTTFIAPILAAKMTSQRGIAFSSGLLFFVGLLGVSLVSSNWVIPFLILIGIGAGTSFSIAVMFFSLRTNSVDQASQLSGMAQSIGYLLAAMGPLLLGGVSEITGGWTTPLILLMITAILISFFGLYAGKPEKIRLNTEKT